MLPQSRVRKFWDRQTIEESQQITALSILSGASVRLCQALIPRTFDNLYDHSMQPLIIN